MKELAGRLAALDPDASAAVQVIPYFDRLLAERAGLAALLRGAAVLTGHTARLADEDRRVHLRMDAQGRRLDRGAPPDPSWPCVPLEPGGPPALWLERPGPAGVVEAMVLERAAAAIGTVLARTRGRADAADQALGEVLLDAAATPAARSAAARRLGLDAAAQARVIVLDGGRARIEPLPPDARSAAGEGTGPVDGAPRAPLPTAVRIVRDGGALAPGDRAGVGPAVPVLELPSSWAAARTAWRFTAEGTERDPGPRVVHADRLGGLAVLAAAVGAGGEPAADVRTLERAASAAPWMLATLDAVAFAASLRGAAAVANVHHSTLQSRLAQAEHLLGWSVHEPEGRLRLQIALLLRRLHHNICPSA
ncbi:helix-turn-helix domain-containing protein [Thermomonospora cellulosilytica]|uniref:PucR C-terminal helix-turn-helix domain-containing protein n=1 Tax=Thermomonospora cellulosilytica TaxID=1411118 RepID=A0A7W3MU66_9ACTN|nr:helix-turn-helix domain-containing protein [Thermomonospora cellulosilytica]MBA9001923.1 hypothetical protein [Thermomonospora cellulosilytica]